ncbi:substrate-binding domain-containing protein [Rhodococcus hoagii]|nr:substrate-binding domain-containing protein [Prescottella equi]
MVQQAVSTVSVVYSVADDDPTWPRCGSGTCRPSSATSPGRCRARRSSGSTTGAPCGRSPTTSSRSDTWRSACCACGSVGIARTASCRERLHAPNFHVQRERIAGVRDAMSDAGLDPSSLTVVERFEHTAQSGTPRPRRPSRSTRRSRHRVHHRRARARCAGLGTLRGLDVPGRVSITGFDGIEEALREGLTTVRQPQEDKGRRAGALLMSGSDSGVTTVEMLETELVRGHTRPSPPEP